MAQVLSQEEVDALLEAVEGNGPDEEGGSGRDEFDDSGAPVQVYDLTNQDRVIRGRMPILEIIYERFIRSFRVSLSNSLRKISTITMVSTDLLKFGEYVNTLPIPSCMCIMRFNTLRGPALMVIDSKLAYAIIDSFFGGTDRPFANIEGKEFTPIELSFLKKIMDMAITDLEEAWTPVHRIDVQYLRTEINPQFVGIVPPSDVIISTTLEIEFEAASGHINFVIPYSTIEPIKQKLSSSFQTDAELVDTLWTNAFNGHLKKSETNLIVKLGQADMTIGDLINLEKGDIIPLGQDASGEINLSVEGVDKIRCLIGTHKGSKAVQILEKIKKGK